jgi:hypothetical protein
MVTYTITLTDTENKALEHFIVDPQDWIENFVKVRCAGAIDEIFQSEIKKMVDSEDIASMPADREKIVLAADIESAKKKQEDRLAALQLDPQASVG